jgi:hypothetical protein
MGTAGVASTEGVRPAGKIADAPATALRVDDVWLDAERTFAKVDVDMSGLVEIDEYAAQAVVYATLARFEGAVPVDGVEAMRVDLPGPRGEGIGAAEQAAIDAIARGDFYAVAPDGQGLSLGDWVALRLQTFGEADHDEDGVLTGRELRSYASAIACYEPSRG